MSLYSLSITQQITANEVLGRTQGYRFRIEVTPGSNFADGGVFVFQRVDLNNEKFSNIASPSQILDVPLNAPDGEGWVRRNTVDLIFSSQIDAHSIRKQILGELKVLCDEMAKLATDLGLPVTTTIASDI